MGLVALQHVGSSRTRDGTRVPFIGRQFLATGPPKKSTPTSGLLAIRKIKAHLIEPVWGEVPCPPRFQWVWGRALESEWKSESRSVVCNSSWPHGLYSPWNSPDQNTGVSSLLQGIFPTQGPNPGLLHCRQLLYQLSHKGSTSEPASLTWALSDSQSRNRRSSWGNSASAGVSRKFSDDWGGCQEAFKASCVVFCICQDPSGPY